jgi:hypothetical protein
VIGQAGQIAELAAVSAAAALLRALARPAMRFARELTRAWLARAGLALECRRARLRVAKGGGEAPASSGQRDAGASRQRGRLSGRSDQGKNRMTADQ